MIQRCAPSEFAVIHEIINDAASAYRDVIPLDCWHDPYMPEDLLRRDIAQGVEFWGSYDGEHLLGVMGIQHVDDVTLIRHAYTRTAYRRLGAGAALLGHLCATTENPVLIGTWRAARWALRFYEQHGFRLVPPSEKDHLLHQYWTVPERQMAESVVLGDRRWFSTTGKSARHVLGRA